MKKVEQRGNFHNTSVSYSLYGIELKSKPADRSDLSRN